MGIHLKISDASIPAITEELSRETEIIAEALKKELSAEQRRALEIWAATLCGAVTTLFDWLPAGEEENVLKVCATWFDIGMFIGRSPQILVNIIGKVNPQIDQVAFPDWVTKNFLRKE